MVYSKKKSGMTEEEHFFMGNHKLDKQYTFSGWYSLVVRARGLEYGGCEFESRSLHLKPETKLREERGLSGCSKGLKTVPPAQALLSLKPAKTTVTRKYCTDQAG